jgi:hypothetical protein
MQPNETEEQEHARLVEEIIAHDDIGYPADSPHVKNHRASLQQASLAHLRDIAKVYARKLDTQPSAV